ncbi:MAG: hypothetical protein ACLTAY_13505 [Thomasclavelia ramosa]
MTYFQHCTTRLRFNLKDRSIVKISDIENVDQVLGSQWSNDELQIIIGPAVADAYAEICEFGNLQEKKQLMKILMEMQKRKSRFKICTYGNYGWDIRMYHADYSNDDWWRNDQSILYACEYGRNLA